MKSDTFIPVSWTKLSKLTQFNQLERGNFDRGGKTAARNIEVTVSVIDLEGKNVENW